MKINIDIKINSCYFSINNIKRINFMFKLDKVKTKKNTTKLIACGDFVFALNNSSSNWSNSSNRIRGRAMI